MNSTPSRAPRGLEQRGDHGAGALAKVVLRRHLRTEIGEGLDCAQQSS